MIDKLKNISKLIWFDNALVRRIERAAKRSDTDVSKWVRAACREKLERDGATVKTSEQEKQA